MWGQTRAALSGGYQTRRCTRGDRHSLFISVSPRSLSSHGWAEDPKGSLNSHYHFQLFLTSEGDGDLLQSQL